MVNIATKMEDVAREIDGVWIDYQDDAKLLIARMGNPQNRKAYERAQARFRGKIKRDKMTADDRIEVMAKCLADSILLDWKGINDHESKKLKYTPEMAYQALRWDLDLREFVADQADLAENFRADEIEEKAEK